MTMINSINEKKGRPDLGSAWIVIECPDTGDVLLGKRAKETNNGGQWNLFGGGIEVGETALLTAVRELWEEAGIRITADRLTELTNTPANLTIFVLNLTQSQARSVVKINRAEIAKVRWFALDNLPQNLHKSTLGLLHAINRPSIQDEPDMPHPAAYHQPSMRGMMDMVEAALLSVKKLLF